MELAKEYALRVKDMAAAEQANAATAAHAAELKAQRQMLLDLRQESEGLLSDRDGQLQQSQEKHQASCVLLQSTLAVCTGEHGQYGSRRKSCSCADAQHKSYLDSLLIYSTAVVSPQYLVCDGL